MIQSSLVQPGTNSHNLTFAPQLAHRLEIMFHVSCYLPLQEHDTQRVERKRHLGNDIVVIVFLEKNASVGFSPLSIKSHFIHTYVVIQVDHHTQKDTFYRICVVSDETVHEVGVLLCGGVWWSVVECEVWSVMCGEGVRVGVGCGWSSKPERRSEREREMRGMKKRVCEKE
jgi:Rap/ran-GAP